MKAIIDLYLYSSLHIAICALCLCLATYMLTFQNPDWNYVLFVSSSTWLLYSLHRIIGIYKVATSRLENRFLVIRKFHNHLIVYASIATVLASYSFIMLDLTVKIWLIVPTMLSVFYVAPLFFGKKRLRDFHYIKIFLVAACWAVLCGTIPMISTAATNIEIVLLSAEKFCFIFAITLPFDLRDIDVDHESGVKTLAHLFPNSFGYLILFLFLTCCLLVVANPLYAADQKITLCIIYLVLEVITRYASRQSSDYFYSGIIDGTMIIFFLGVWISQ